MTATTTTTGLATDEDNDECPYKIESDEVLFRGQWMSGRQVTFTDKASGVQKVGYDHQCNTFSTNLRKKGAQSRSRDEWF